MRRSLWSLAVAVLALGALGMVGSTAVGGEVAPIGVSGALLTLCGLYMVAGLAIRDRTWKRLRHPEQPTTPVERLAGRRIF
jgi:membrane associated rhomboid family serine protease